MPMMHAIDVPVDGVFTLECGCVFKKITLNPDHAVRTIRECDDRDKCKFFRRSFRSFGWVHYDPLASELEGRFG